MRQRLLIFGYPLLEFATAYVVALWIGWGWTILLLLVGIPAGLAVMRNAGDAALQDLAKANQTGQPVDSGRHALTFVGGLLIAIPGFWTDLLGALLVIPVTQRLVRARSRGWLEKRFTVVRMPGIRYPADGDVVEGTVVYPDSEPPPGNPDGGRGEIEKS